MNLSFLLSKKGMALLFLLGFGLLCLSSFGFFLANPQYSFLFLFGLSFFFFVFFSSIFALSKNIYLIFFAHLLLALSFIFFARSFFSWQIILSLVLLYLSLQALLISIVSFLGRNTLRVNILLPFRISWRLLGIFFIAWSVFFFTTHLNYYLEVNKQSNSSVLVEKALIISDPFLGLLGLPQSSTTLNQEIEQSMQQAGISLQSKQEAVQQVADKIQSELEISASENDTLKSILSAYLFKKWSELELGSRTLIQIALSLIALLFLFPVVSFLGNIVSFLAPPLFALCRLLGVFEIQEEQAIKESVLL